MPRNAQARDLSIASEMTERILSANPGRVVKVILYGSRAEGTADSDSDFDLLVVEADVPSPDIEMNHLRKSLLELRGLADIRVMSERDFEATKSIVGYLAYPAHHHGTILYERRPRSA